MPIEAAIIILDDKAKVVMHTMQKYLSLSYLAAVAILIGLISLPVFAISKGYMSDDSGLQPGMAVKISENESSNISKVERATADVPDKVIGIVTTIDETTVAIGSEGQSIYVETSGEVNAYVSDINGKVKSGDLLTISPLNGVLAKHTNISKSVFGLAIEDFPEQPMEKHTISTSQGEKVAGVSLIKVNLDQKNVLSDQKERSILSRYGKAIVGKEVSDIRIAAALIIFVIVLISEGAILYGAISSAVASIGRNPLAKNYIKQELLKVIVVALAVLLFGLGSIYLILWS